MLPKLTNGVVYLPTPGGDQQQLNSWSKISEMVSGVFTLNDYDYQGPGKNLLATAQGDYKFEHGKMEIYRFIGDYDKKDEGQKLANVALDVDRTHNQRYSAFGYAPSLTPGYRINRTTPAGKTDDGENGEYVVLRCSHSYGYQTYASGSSGGGGGAYVGNYEFANSKLQYRMPQRTRKPFIPGTQSALVVGKQGEEIDVDELRPNLRSFLLGPQEEGVAPDSGGAILGGQQSRRAFPAAHRR